MALYLTKLVNGQVQKLRVSPTKAIYRGYWAVIVGGFAGTSVTCNGVTKFIGSSERVAFNIITPGTYTFTATRQGTTITKEITLNDDTQEYIINLSMFIGMQQLEYIESTGTQWIDTGIIPDENTNVKVKASYVEIIPSSQYDSVVGSTAGGVDYRFYPFGYTFSTGKIRQTYGSAQYEQTFDTNIHTVDFNNSNKQVVVDGTVVGSTTSGFVKSENQPSLYLFATNVKRNLNSTPEWYGAVRLYALQIYDNGTLVSDMIPIKDDTGRGALYDKVTQQIFYNSGTGDFICGPNKPYTRIQYLESTGTQWIDSGVTLSNRLAVETVFQTTSVDRQMLFGDGTYYNNNQRFYLDIINNNFRLARGTGYVEFTRADTNKHTLRFASDTPTVMWDGNPITVGGSFSGTSTDSTVKIFASSPINPNQLGHVKYYSFKMYKNDELVRDFVPVLDYDGIPCMLDRVEGRLYYNQGTGEYIAGPEILPDEYVELEYLQSSGTQYIDTGVVGNLNTEYEITVKNNSSITSGVYAIFGSRTSATENIITTVCANPLHSILNDFGDTTTTRQMPTRTSAEMLHRYKITNGKSQRTLTDLDTGWTDTVTTTYSGSLTTPTNLYIGYAGSISGISDIANLQGNIYGCKIWNNDTLIRDFVPARRLSDNVLGMYDIVSQQFFTNAGTGEFIAGPEK